MCYSNLRIMSIEVASDLQLGLFLKTLHRKNLGKKQNEINISTEFLITIFCKFYTLFS